MNSFDPRDVDTLRFCKMAQAWEMHGGLSEFPRLQAEFAEGQLHCRVTGRTDRQHGCILRVEISGEVETTCQRCLGGLTQGLAIVNDIALVRDEAEQARVEAEAGEEMDTVLISAKLSLIDLIEDEVLLGLPLAPMHTPDACATPDIKPAVIN